MEVIQISQRQKRAVQVLREVHEADQAAHEVAVHEADQAAHEAAVHEADHKAAQAVQ